MILMSLNYEMRDSLLINVWKNKRCFFY